MSKKESNPMPEGAVKPPSPPAPPPKRIIKEDVDREWFLRFAKTMARPILWGYSDEEIDMT